jgi:V/A-type H+/Na+-transporting ATPase subunit I
VAERVDVVATQVDALVAERAQVADELDGVATYLPTFRDLAPTWRSSRRAATCTARPRSSPPRPRRRPRRPDVEALEGRIAFEERPRGGKQTMLSWRSCAATRHAAAALTRLGLAELQLPERYRSLGVAKAVHTMEERQQSLPKRQASIAEELRKLALQHGPRLKAYQQTAINHRERLERMLDLAQGRYAFALKGWVPQADRPRVTEALRKQFGDDLIVRHRPADEHHDVGVPGAARERGLGAPLPGPPVAVRPPALRQLRSHLDAGGVLPAVLRRHRGRHRLRPAVRARGVPAAAPRPAGQVAVAGAAEHGHPRHGAPPHLVDHVLGGGLDDRVGLRLRRVLRHLPRVLAPGRPIFYTTLHHEPGYGLIEIILFRVEVFTPLILIAIGFGVLQILGGWVIRVIYGIKHNDMKHVYEGIGMFTGISALVIFASAFLTDNLNPVVNGIVGIGFAVFAVCVVLARMPLMIIELVSNGGNILSYLRLFAVGLAAALVAKLATELGFAISGTLPVIGPILGILVGLFVHLLALVLKVIGYTLQPLRLQYVEFYTKFGFYEASGRPYQPFKLLGGKS